MLPPCCPASSQPLIGPARLRTSGCHLRLGLVKLPPRPPNFLDMDLGYVSSAARTRLHKRPCSVVLDDYATHERPKVKAWRGILASSSISPRNRAPGSMPSRLVLQPVAAAARGEWPSISPRRRLGSRRTAGLIPHGTNALPTPSRRERSELCRCDRLKSSHAYRREFS
jgi:hypothetical protein